MTTTTSQLPAVVQDILQSVTRATSTRASEILENAGTGSRGPRDVVTARQLCVALLHQTTTYTRTRVAAFFRRDQTHVRDSLHAVANRITADQAFAELYTALLDRRQVLRPLVKELHVEHVPGRITPVPVSSPRHCQSVIHPSTEGLLHELREDIVRAKLKDAHEQLAYWNFRRFQEPPGEARAAAGARVLLWENEVAAIRRRLREFNRLTA